MRALLGCPGWLFVATTKVVVAWLGSWVLGELFALLAMDSVFLLLVHLGAFVLWEVPAQKDFLLCWGIHWAALLEAHVEIAVECCYCAFLVIPAHEGVLHALLGPLSCVGVCRSTLPPCEIYFRGCQAI